MGMHCPGGKDKTGPWSDLCKEVEIEPLQTKNSKVAHGSVSMMKVTALSGWRSLLLCQWGSFLLCNRQIFID